MFLRVASAVMALVFVYSVAVQYNDPDAPVWMAIYGAAAVLSVLAALRPGRPQRLAALLIAVIAASWSLTLVPGVAGRVTWAEIAGDYAMKTHTIEEARESIGLGIVAAWTLLLAIVWRPRAGRG